MTEIFEDIRRTHLTDVPECPNPESVWVLSQPGGGKSRSVRRWPPALPGCRPLRIVGDDFKAFHPSYEPLLARCHRTAGQRIRPYYQTWQAWTEEFVRKLRGDAVIESAPGSAEQFLDSVAPFREAGYGTRLDAVATRPADSRLGTAVRYLRTAGPDRLLPARFTTAAGHDQCVTALAASVRAAEQEAAVDQVRVRRPDGTLLYEARRGPDGFERPGALAALEAEWNRPYTDAEATGFVGDLVWLHRRLPEYREELREIGERALPLLPAGLRLP
ncbi:hypothetical protein M2161_007079 [Streptomyces sp. SAI-133]|uniref:zeta toxin family protein n=1 Tax=unclassified Streptomyces TaxID=2593676 RepID=UPI0024768B48|nr:MULTISPECIES: zeta toxin family protein [unclassified Streptomyces]MDH6548003.1 hypothetical protein [Streptomyces sp. SAI-041]MDH6587973.1 hypothetical protein [Streptomyces sp. SAI-133]